ncbi:hypothetical protein ACPX19_02585 [Winogradskyella sp. HB-48]|uniref:hypothetical protein n=1 Tax=Winogradskyella sp. HB-48 TaxID=3416808 RepID=UPI003CF48784
MSASYMSTSIKNNLNLLSKREKLRNTLGSYSKANKTEYNLPKASKKQLSNIAKQIREEHRVRMAKIVVVTIILFFVLVSAFLYAKGGIIQLLTY